MATLEQCPACGAPIDLAGGPTTCPWCGAHVEPDAPGPPPPADGARRDERAEALAALLGGIDRVEDSRREAPPPGATDWLPSPHRAAPEATRASRLGLVILAVVVLSALLPIGLLVWSKAREASAGPLGGSWNADDAAVVLPGPVPPEVVVHGSRYQPEPTRQGLLLLGADGKARWARTDLDPEDGRNAALAGDADRVYVADGTRLRALTRVDGTPVWEATLASAPAPRSGCPGCLVVVGAKVVVLGRDGSVQAHDAATGAPAWTTALDQSPSRLDVYGGRVGAVVAGAGGGSAALALFDPATGARTDVHPACTRPGDRSPGHLSTSDRFVPVEGGFVVAFESEGCLQRYGIESGAPLWQALVGGAEAGADLPDLDDAAVAGGRLTFGDDDAVISADLATGALAVVPAPDRYGVKAVGSTPAGLVLLVARPDFDRDHPQLWAVDPAHAAQPVWRRPIVATGSSEEWWIGVAPAGVALVECVEKPKDHCTFTTLDPATGAVRAQGTGGDIFSAAFLDVTASGDRLWVTAGTKTFTVDVARGGVVGRWP